MSRFFKNRSSPAPTPPKNSQARQTTDVDAERDRNPQGEHRSREISELIRLMGLIQPSHQIPTAQRVLRSQTRTEVSRINNFLRQMPQLRPLGTAVGTRVSTVRCSFYDQHLSSIPIVLQEQDVRRPPETALEPTFAGGQDVGGVHDPGEPGGKSRYPSCIAAHVEQH